jgi:2-C-methyl-D-erythritol 2,4-cyclodiphosphate synthase
VSTRFGIGYDAHPLTPGVRLVLGGVAIEHHSGLAGHSDGDVATHAIIDALLGAAALGDIGTYFQPGDPSVPEGISSLELLERTMGFLASAGWRVVNVDATIVAQRPRLAEQITAMRSAIAHAIGTALENVSVKATTEDGMGYTGSGQGISAMAVASVTELSGTELTA